MVAKDTTKYAASLAQVTQACSQAITARLLSRKTAVEVIEAVSGRLGVSFDAEAELAAIDAEPTTDNPDTLGAGPIGKAQDRLVPAQKGDVPTKKPAALTEAKKGQTQGIIPTDPPGEMVHLLGVSAQPAIDSMLDTIRAMLDNASDLPEAMRNMEALFPEMDDTALADILAKAFLAANLAGRERINNGR